MSRFQHVKDVEFLHRVIALYEHEIDRLLARIAEQADKIAELKGKAVDAYQLELGNLKQELDRLHKSLIKALNTESPDPEEQNGKEASEGGSQDATGEPGSPPEETPVGSTGQDKPEGEPNKKKRKPRSRFGHRSQPLLPVETHIHKHEEGELICPHCEREAFPLEGVFQTWYEIDIIAPRIVINEHKQQKYQCKNRCTIWTAPGPLKLSPNAYYSPDFALEIVSDKYLDNMPLERQVRRFERLGLEVDSQTLFDQLYTVFEYARPTVEAIHGNLLGQDVLHADETPWYMLEGPSAGQWTLWALACDHGAFFSASSTRSAVAANILLEGYDGTVICDGASIYPALVGHGGEKTKTEVMEIFKPSGDMETILVRATKWTVPAMTLAFCWAHVLRRFRDCEKHFPRLAGQALTYIRKLYAAEDEALNLARARAGPDISPDAFETLLLEARRTVRQAVSRPVVEAFHPWLCTPRVLGSTQLGEAIDYTLKLWKGLCVFLNDPQVVLDNNAAELILRQAVVGRKAHYGSHSLRGIQVACAFYTLVESARLNGLEPVAYLRRVLYAALETPGTVTLPWVVAQNTERTVTLQARPKARPSWETCSEEAQEEQVG